MEKESKAPTYTRRQLFIRCGLAALIGVVLTVGVGALVWYKHLPHPLQPGYGDAQSSLKVEWLPDTVKRWQQPTEKYAHDYQIDPNLVAIIMTIESGGDPNADSGLATGLMQITPARAEDISSKFLHKPRSDYDLKDPETSIEFGAANIRRLVDEFGDRKQAPSWDETVALVAAGYNGGEGAANVYYKQGLNGIKDQQIHSYVRFVTTMWKERHDDKSFAYRYWFDQGNGQALVKNAEAYIK